MTRILLTNDDGIDSPALLPTIEALEKVGEVTAIVPSKNRSWTSKMNTRVIEPINKNIVDLQGREVTTLDALPADCSNYGIYLDKKPDVVVAGANLGHNVGISAYLASGTIGAAMEGLLANVPSIALSAPYFPGTTLSAGAFEQTVELLPKIVTRYLSDTNKMSLLMLNLPLGLRKTGMVAATISRWIFGRLFVDHEDHIIPINYPDLNQNAPIPKYSDAWCRQHKLGSIVALDENLQIINRNNVHEWLNKHQLHDENCDKID